jgi:hypothetical protein
MDACSRLLTSFKPEMEGQGHLHRIGGQTLKYLSLLILLAFIGCAGTAGVSAAGTPGVATDGTGGTYKEIGGAKVEPSLVENADTEDGLGNKLSRMKQSLGDTQVILGRLKNYFFMFNRDGDMCINSCIIYPNLAGSLITDYSHIARDYDGAHVDLTEMSIKLESGTVINVRLFFPFISSQPALDLLFFSAGEYLGTKGYYEYGDALKALNGDAVGSYKNGNKVVLKKARKTVNGVTHWYLSMGPASSVYDFITDVYSKIIIDIYGDAKDGRDKEIDDYINFVIEHIRYL